MVTIEDNRKSNTTVRLKDAEVGCVFEIGNVLFMKTDDTHSAYVRRLVECVRLEDGRVMNLSEEIDIVPINITISIKD